MEGAERPWPRSRLAWSLRRIADRIDGRQSLALGVTRLLNRGDLLDAVNAAQRDIAARIAVLAALDNDMIGGVLVTPDAKRTEEMSVLANLVTENPALLSRLDFQVEELPSPNGDPQ